MLLTKRVKAGVLLYALLMASVFTLVLQFYSYRVVASERQLQAQLLQAKADLIAVLTKELATAEKGNYHFADGDSRYRYEENTLMVDVRVDQQTYTFVYANARPLSQQSSPQSESSLDSTLGNEMSSLETVDSEHRQTSKEVISEQGSSEG